MRQRGFGWKHDRLDHRDKKYSLPLHEKIYVDEEFDLRSLMPPVYNQGSTNSCVANAVCANVQYLRVAQGLPDFVPSRLFTYWAARNMIGEANLDNGSEPRDAIKAVAKLGVPPESLWPFEDNLVTVCPSKEAFTAATHDIALQYSAVPQLNYHFASCLKHKMPIVFGASIFAAMDSDSVAQSGVVPMPSADESSIGGHAMLIVGATKDHYIVRNSWSKSWGDAGHAYFPKAYLLNSNLASDFWTIINMSQK